MLYHPKVMLGYKLTKFKTISCGTGHEPWVAATYGGNKSGFDVFEGHPICSDPGESQRVGNPRIMGDRVNSRSTNVLGWITTVAIFSASAGLVASWLI